MQPTLVIIDMQDAFDAACDPDVIIGVTLEILRAKERRTGILIVEYADCGDTHHGFFDLLKGYPYRARCRKREDDGSIEVIRALRRREFNMSHLRVCGVNGDACVVETVSGLLDRLPRTRIDVVKKAVGWSEAIPEWRTYWPKHPQVHLV